MTRAAGLLSATHVVARSGNAKTGDIPVTYRPESTCPRDCPFLPSGEIGGCYGTGRIFGTAARYASDASVDDVVTKVAAGKSRTARFLRDRVVGDVVTPDGSVDMPHILAVADVARRTALRAFGYTHAWRRFTRDDVAATADSGYVLNASCETRDDVRAAVALGMPAVIANDAVLDGEIIAGRRVVTCPAQTRDDVTCASCGLCARPQRAAVVRFLIHGTARRRAAAAVAAREG